MNNEDNATVAELTELTDKQLLERFEERIAVIDTAIRCMIGSYKDVAISERDRALAYFYREREGYEAARDLKLERMRGGADAVDTST